MVLVRYCKSNFVLTESFILCKSLQMMRLVKDNSNELGIIISSKKNTGNGMSGYSIAHIEPRGLIDR